VEAVSSLLSIILINLVLSGDNALVIGMAAHRLPPRQRRTAIVVGTTAAVVLRVALTLVAALLLQVPFLDAVGGVLLLWIAFKLLEEEEEEHDKSVPEGMRAAITTIVIADVVMSLDNILGVAGAAHGETWLLAVGLVISMILVMFGGSLVAALLNRFWWLAYLATAIIAWTGADMVFSDEGLVRLVPPLGDPQRHAVEVAASWAIALFVVAFAHWYHRSSQNPVPAPSESRVPSPPRRELG
jgi:YjbE family integral membrane protein